MDVIKTVLTLLEVSCATAQKAMHLEKMATHVMVRAKSEIYFSSCYNVYSLLDIDECLLDIDGCDQGCNNTLGSFLCTCSEGYILNENGFSCEGEGILML